MIFRTSHGNLFYEKGILEYFATLTGKHLCWSLFLNNKLEIGLGISMSCSFGFGILMRSYMRLHDLVFIFIKRTEKITHFNHIVKEYFNYSNLCNSCISAYCKEVGIINRIL